MSSADSLTVWSAILSRCESSVLDLGAAPAEHRECAVQMRDAGILVETEPACFTLSTGGQRLLLLLEKLRDYSLGTN